MTPIYQILSQKFTLKKPKIYRECMSSITFYHLVICYWLQRAETCTNFINQPALSEFLNLSDRHMYGNIFYRLTCMLIGKKCKQSRWNRLYSVGLAKQQLCTCITLFCSLTFTVSLPSLHDYNVKGLISRFVEDVNEDKDFLFLFLNFDTIF